MIMRTPNFFAAKSVAASNIYNFFWFGVYLRLNATPMKS